LLPVPCTSAEPDRFHALYVLAVHTGMRPGELLALKWEDVEATIYFAHLAAFAAHPLRGVGA
jgi:integrase